MLANSRITKPELLVLMELTLPCFVHVRVGVGHPSAVQYTWTFVPSKYDDDDRITAVGDSKRHTIWILTRSSFITGCMAYKNSANRWGLIISNLQLDKKTRQASPLFYIGILLRLCASDIFCCVGIPFTCLNKRWSNFCRLHDPSVLQRSHLFHLDTCTSRNIPTKSTD